MIIYKTGIIKKLFENFKYTIIRKYIPATKSVTEYINIPCGFDIETTSTYNDDEKVAFMYLWSVGILNEDYIFYGRTWDEFLNLLDELQDVFKTNKDCILPIYVHNLSYEFQFMRKYLVWENVFAVDDRKPIKALCNKGIEFRDSYILSGYSLEKLADNLVNHTIEKLVGNLDYSLIRHEKTYIEENELEYLNNDVLIIIYYIQEQIEQYGDITKIPLTNTGRVRKYVRDNCLHYKKSHKKEGRGKISRYKALMDECSLSLDVYYMCKRAFMGGFTHASMKYSGELLHDVSSIDFTSSYPFCMISEYFPMSRPKKGNIDEFEKYLNDEETGILFDCVFINLQSINTFETYLSKSKCRDIRDEVINNGRVFYASYLETTITDIDFKIIKNCYSYDKMIVLNCYTFYMTYLPYQIITSILDLYEKKTMLKGVEGKEIEYLVSKGMLNSVYGMTVTDIVRPEIIYTDKWDINKTLTRETAEEQLQKYNESRNRFLYYPWGIWVTAYARKNLWDGIFAIGEDYVYSDTDSIKFLNYKKHKKWIEKYNKEVVEKLQKMCNFRKINFERCRPKTIKGKKKLIGVFDFEGTYPLFKTLGAKRYMYTNEDNKLHITIAGLSKQDGVSYLLEKYGTIENVFKNFDDELTIPADRTGKNTHTYIDEEKEIIVTDYTGITTTVQSKSAIHLEPCSFTLSIAKQYAQFLEELQKGYLYTGVKHI